MPDPIVVVPWDASWPAQFEALATRARRVLAVAPPIVARIEHVGSTAVPGLAAKPVIDLDVIVPNDQMPATVTRLEPLGYRAEGDKGIPGRLSMRWPAGEPRHHLYVCHPDAPALHEHLALRDHLRRDPEARAAYGALKLALARRFPDDREAYLDGKTAFIRDLLARDAGRPA